MSVYVLYVSIGSVCERAHVRMCSLSILISVDQILDIPELINLERAASTRKMPVSCKSTHQQIALLWKIFALLYYGGIFQHCMILPCVNVKQITQLDSHLIDYGQR